jgi:flagellar capping protein FliD
MNPVAILNTQFIQVALPIMLTLGLAAWLNGKGIDAVGKRIDDVRSDMKDIRSDMKDMRSEVRDLRGEMNRRFDRLESMFSDHEKRIVTLEERTSPLSRR